MGKIIAISLGIGNAAVSYINDKGEPEILKNKEGGRKTPTAVFFDPDGQTVYVGEQALAEGAFNPELLFTYLPKHFGDEDFSVFAAGREVDAKAIAEFIFHKIISDAEEQLKDLVEGVLLSYPPYYGDKEKSILKEAFESLKIIYPDVKLLKLIDNETAAGYYYLHDDKEHKTVALYDLGEAEFNFSVVRMVDGVCKTLCRTKDGLLGGKDWDNRLSHYVVDEFCNITGCDPDEMWGDPEVQAWLLENVERAKKMLTNKPATSLTPTFDGMKQKVEIDRGTFEEITQDLLDRTFKIIDKFEEKYFVLDSVDEVILVGGASKMSQVKRRAEEFFKKDVILTDDCDLAACYGTALIARDKDFETLSKEPLEYGEKPHRVLDDLRHYDDMILPHYPDWLYNSYGFEIDINGKKYVKNLIVECVDTPVGSCKMQLTGKHEPIYEHEFTIYKNKDSREVMPLKDCVCAYLLGTLKVKFKEKTYGDDILHIKFEYNCNLEISIFNERTFEHCYYSSLYACTLWCSYGIEVKTGGEKKVLNLIYQDDVFPASGSVQLDLNGKHEKIENFEVKVYQSESKEKFCEISECEDCFKPINLKFERETYGDDVVHIQMISEGRDFPKMRFFNERTFEYIECEIKRKPPQGFENFTKLKLD